MKKFWDYFWNSTSNNYEDFSTNIFSIYHLLMLLMLYVIFYYLNKKAKKLNTKKEKEKHLRNIGISLLILEVLRVINYMTAYNYSFLSSLSWHLCSIGVYLAILLTLFKKQYLYDSLVLHAIIGAPFAIIIPMGILSYWSLFSFMPIQSFITHLLLIYVGIYSYKEKLYEIRRKNYYIPIISITLSVLVGYLFSLYNLTQNGSVSTNFIWTIYLDDYFLFLTKIPHPYYIFVLLSIFLSVGYLFYFIMEKRSIKDKTI